jgi:hypothetical protein
VAAVKLAAAEPPAPAPAPNAGVLADAKTILDAGSRWRWVSFWSKPVVTVEALKATGKDASAPVEIKCPDVGASGDLGITAFETLNVEPPSPRWKDVDFDDLGWGKDSGVTRLPLGDFLASF